MHLLRFFGFALKQGFEIFIFAAVLLPVAHLFSLTGLIWVAVAVAEYFFFTPFAFSVGLVAVVGIVETRRKWKRDSADSPEEGKAFLEAYTLYTGIYFLLLFFVTLPIWKMALMAWAITSGIIGLVYAVRLVMKG